MADHDVFFCGNLWGIGSDPTPAGCSREQAAFSDRFRTWEKVESFESCCRRKDGKMGASKKTSPYPTKGDKENRLQTCLGWGYVSSQEGRNKWMT